MGLFNTLLNIAGMKRKAMKVKQLAESGDLEAQVTIAGYYYKGDGVPRDLSLAVEWNRRAANSGYAKGQYNLGCFYHAGEGVPRDWQEAMEWWKKSAAQNHTASMRNLAITYMYAEGVPQDLVEATRWLNKAIALGDKKASVTLRRLPTRAKFVQGVRVDDA